MDNTRMYTEQEIIKLVVTIELNQNSVEAFKWLMQNNCIELAALCDVLVNGNAPAREWLDKNNYITITAFIDAISPEENDYSLQILKTGTYKEWAAVASMVNDGDDEAETWLIKNGMKYYAAFGDILDAKIEESNTRKMAVEGGLAVAGLVAGAILGGLGGRGFSVFGGGSFGGGGGGGEW